MIQSIVTTTSLLVLASFASKVVSTPQHSELNLKAHELMRTCLQWRDLSNQDTDMVLRLQHATLSTAFLASARLLMRDVELERASGVDINALTLKLEKTVEEARGMLDARKASKGASV
jgi:hypothetical protein